MITNTALYLSTGLILGLTAGIAPGPLSALLVAQTLRHGVREGLKIAVAPIITDLPIIGASLWLMLHLPNNPWPVGLISLLGGAYLIFLSYSSFTATASRPEAQLLNADSLKKGALVNLLNPHPYLFWLTVGAPLMINMWDAAPWSSAGWLIGFYTALVGAKIALAFIVGQTKRWIDGRGYRWLNRIMGILLGLFAIIFTLEGLRLLRLIDQ